MAEGEGDVTGCVITGGVVEEGGAGVVGAGLPVSMGGAIVAVVVVRLGPGMVVLTGTVLYGCGVAPG